MPDTLHHRSDTVFSDGLFLREFRPAHTPRGVFLLLHGMESHSGWWGHIAARLVGQGWAAIAFDNVGWGKSPGQRGHLQSYRLFVENAVRIASNARERYGAVHLAGMSWGGMAALYLGLRRGWLFDSLSCLAPGLAVKRAIPLRGKAAIAYNVIRGCRRSMVTPVLRPVHFTRKPEWQNFIATDPDRVNSVSTSFCIETLKMQRFIKEMAGRRMLPPALCLLGADDEVIDNANVEDLCRRAGALVEVLPDASHTLIFENPAQVADRLSRHAGDAAGAAVPTRTVWVAGAGAVGGALASLLAYGGVRTGVLTKPEYLPALRRNGFSLSSGGARRAAGAAIHVADTPKDLPDNPDLIIIAVKSFDTPALLAELSGAVPATTVIASLQNGVGNEECIAGAFPANTLIAGSICASLELSQPGQTLWADDRGGLAASLYRGDSSLAGALWQTVMARTGLECLWVEGTNASTRLKWSKLMLNIGFNALNSVTGQSTASLLGNPGHGQLAVDALREGFAVMDRLRLEPVDLPGFPVSKLRLLLKIAPKAARRILTWQASRTPEVAFSMRQDLLKNRQHTEIEELNGKIVSIGRQFGMKVEANEKLVEMVKNLKINT